MDEIISYENRHSLILSGWQLGALVTDNTDTSVLIMGFKATCCRVELKSFFIKSYNYTKIQEQYLKKRKKAFGNIVTLLFRN